MRKDNRGFSLIELIIVITIMTILAGAIGVALIRYIEKARISTQEHNAATYFEAANAAILDFNVWFEGQTTEGATYLGAEGADHYYDPVTNQNVGRITNWILYRSVHGGYTSDTSRVDQDLCRRVAENIGTDLDYAKENPIGSTCNFTDGKMRIEIIYTADEGVIRVEFSQYRNLLTTITLDGGVKTEKYSSKNKDVKFSKVGT